MSNKKPSIITFDLEGVFIPEVWIAVAEATQLDELRLTTRDIVDYNELMQHRINILTENDVKLHDIQAVIGQMEPLVGASEFLSWVRQRAQILIITDSFYEFVEPFLPKLNYPTVFAHTLEIADSGHIAGFHLRTENGKQKVIKSLHSLGFRTMAVGDSYNDTAMLLAADSSSLFRPPPNVISDFPQIPVSENYAKLTDRVENFIGTSRA